jgi:hypothetical protein
MKFHQKIRPVKDKLFHAEGWTVGETDRQVESNSRSSKFCYRV